MTRVYAILAHPNKDSLSGYLFYKSIQCFKDRGATVDVLDLYEHADNIPLFVSPKERLESNAFFQQNKERFMAADRLFIVYPIYWYAVPGILKCWFDLITNFAWKYDGSRIATPLHGIKKALVVNSAGMSNWSKWLFTRNSGTEMVKESFKWMGINDYRFYEIGNANSLTSVRIDAHLQKILGKSGWFLE